LNAMSDKLRRTTTTTVPVNMKLKPKPGESESEMLERGAAQAAAFAVAVAAGPTPWALSTRNNAREGKWQCKWGPLTLTAFCRWGGWWRYCVAHTGKGRDKATFPPASTRFAHRHEAQAAALKCASGILGVEQQA
jgi:hypothetical protein